MSTSYTCDILIRLRYLRHFFPKSKIPLSARTPYQSSYLLCIALYRIVSYWYHSYITTHDGQTIHIWYIHDMLLIQTKICMDTYHKHTRYAPSDTHTIHTRYTHDTHRITTITARSWYKRDTLMIRTPPKGHPTSTPKAPQTCAICAQYERPDTTWSRADLIWYLMWYHLRYDVICLTILTTHLLKSMHLIRMWYNLICIWYVSDTWDMPSTSWVALVHKNPQKFWQKFPQKFGQKYIYVSCAYHMRIMCVSCIYHLGIITHIWKYISQTCCPWSERICVVS